MQTQALYIAGIVAFILAWTIYWGRRVRTLETEGFHPYGPHEQRIRTLEDGVEILITRANNSGELFKNLVEDSKRHKEIQEALIKELGYSWQPPGTTEGKLVKTALQGLQLARTATNTTQDVPEATHPQKTLESSSI